MDHSEAILCYLRLVLGKTKFSEEATPSDGATAGVSEPSLRGATVVHALLAQCNAGTGTSKGAECLGSNPSFATS